VLFFDIGKESGASLEALLVDKLVASTSAHISSDFIPVYSHRSFARE
jgi:hypothetical protein